MENTETLDALAAECWENVEKQNLKKEIRGTPFHLRVWKVNRGIRDYEEIFSVFLNLYIETQLRNMASSEKFVVLDMGCGSGKFLNEITTAHPSIAGYGIANILFEGEYSKNRILIGDLASTHYNNRDTQYSTPVLPYILPLIPDNSANLITSIFTLQYLPEKDIANAIDHARRILKPKGLALLHIDTSFTDSDHVKKHVQSLDSSVHSAVYSQHTGKLNLVRINKQ